MKKSSSRTSLSERQIFPSILLGAIWTLSSICSETVFAQAREVPRQAVDILLFKNQKPIRGLILNETPTDGISIAVAKKWLEHENADAYSKAVDAAEKGAIQARLQFRDRLRGLEGTQTGALGFLISKELERIEIEIEKAPEDYQFLVMQFKAANVANRKFASAGLRKIAVWSWHEGLKDVESRTPSNLQEELKSKGIDFDSMPPSLADRFYPTVESDEQWTVRMAIVSQRLGKPMEFQGSGDVMVAVGDERPPDLSALTGKMMQSQMNSLLQELSSDGKKTGSKGQAGMQWIKTAIAQAEKAKSPYLRATQVAMDSQQGVATVESVFMAQLANGNWTVAWKSMAAEKATDQKPDEVDRISKDPQIQEIKKQLELFGAASLSLDNAIRMGAATKTAQSQVNEAFQQFSERYVKRLNSPPIEVNIK